MIGDLVFDEIVGRLKEALGISTDAALAEALGMGDTAYSNRKRAGSVPLEAILKLVGSRKLSVEWALWGTAPASQPSVGGPLTPYRPSDSRPPGGFADPAHEQLWQSGLERMKRATDLILEAEREAGHKLPHPWPHLVQEMIVLHGMDPAAVRRILEVLKQEEGKR